MSRDIFEELKTKNYKEILSSIQNTDILFLSCVTSTVQLNREIYCESCPYNMKCTKSIIATKSAHKKKITVEEMNYYESFN